MTVGGRRKLSAPVVPDPDLDAAVTASEASWEKDKLDAAKRLLKLGVEGKVRPGAKILTLFGLLQEPGGATIVTLFQATGWLPHTIRGAISAIVKKKLGFHVVPDKGPGGDRVYKIDISRP